MKVREWALAVSASEYEAPRVRGFGLAGFQYLRALLGAPAVKPDVHIKRFVSGAVGRSIQDWEALSLLETAASQLSWDLSALDNEVWSLQATGRKLD